MQTVLIVTIALHVLAGVFWAGSTFTLARTGGAQAERLFGPQMGAATVAVVTGVVLWQPLHGGGAFGSSEAVLAVGILTALIAAGVQGASVGPARRGLAAAADKAEERRLRARMAMGQRIAAGLLAVTVVSMAVARFA